MILWHPDAEQTPTRIGSPYSTAEPVEPRLVLHTWEFSSRWPAFTDYPPHLALWPRPFSPTGEAQLRQYIPFNLAAHSIRSSAVEQSAWTWQVEIAGRASQTPGYPDEWYEDVAELIGWFHTALDVPLTFADFTVMQYGTDAPQRMDLATYRAFTGICGHGHVGRGIDTHWDPGMVDTARLTQMIGGNMFAQYVQGWVAGLAEDPVGTEERFRRLFGERPGNQPQTDYWMAKIPNPADPEWPGFYARRELEFWALASEGA